MKIIDIFILLLFVFLTSSYSQFASRAAESYGDQLIIGHVAEAPTAIRPFQVNNVIEKQLVRLVFGTGLEQGVDRFGDAPQLVNSRIVSTLKPQGIDWQYLLIRNIFFHDGSSFRNDDVKFTFELLKKYGGYILNRRLDFSNIDRIETSGDLNFTIVLKEKDNFFNNNLSDIPILSHQYYENVFLDGYEYFKRDDVKPLGYGPFMLESISPQAISLIFHPNYAFGRPFLNRIIYRFYNNEQEMLDDFIQGKVDLIEIKEKNTYQRLAQILKSDIKIFSTPRPEKKFYYIMFNVNKEPFNYPKVRFAVRAGINRSDIINNLVETNAHVAYSVIDYTNNLFYKELFGEHYDPETSIENLGREGWRIGTPRGILEKDGQQLNLELLFEANSYLEESIARSIKIQLAELGINVQPKPASFREKQLLVSENQYTAVLQNYSYYDDNLYDVVKDFYFSILKGQSRIENYTNSTIENMFEQSDLNPDLRKPHIQRFQIYLHTDAPAIFLYFDDRIIYGLSNRFHSERVIKRSDTRYLYRLMPFENWYVPKSLQKYTVK